MIAIRALYAVAAVSLVAGLVLRLAPAARPGPGAAPLALPAAGAGAAPRVRGAAPSYEAVVAANIFSQTRAAPRVRFTPAGLGGGPPARRVARRPVLQLYGITVGPQGAVALIHADPKLRGAQIYRIGDLVAGARLVAITDSTVTLAEPSGPLVLRLESTHRTAR